MIRRFVFFKNERVPLLIATWILATTSMLAFNMLRDPVGEQPCDALRKEPAAVRSSTSLRLEVIRFDDWHQPCGSVPLDR